MHPTAYTLRHARGYGSRSSLRNWIFQVSKDGHDWITIRTHTNDASLGEPGWVLPECKCIFPVCLSGYCQDIMGSTSKFVMDS